MDSKIEPVARVTAMGGMQFLDGGGYRDADLYSAAALLAAEQRGRESERERCAQIADDGAEQAEIARLRTVEADNARLRSEVERLTRERDEAQAGWKTASELLYIVMAVLQDAEKAAAETLRQIGEAMEGK